MKKILLFIILFLNILLSLGFALSKPSSYVTDEVNVISVDAKTYLEALISEVEKKTSAEIAVVVIRSLDGDTIENYAVNLFEQWGIGKKGKDNGVLLLIAMNDRRLRIEVGYGLEGAITDGRAGEIIRNVITPRFKNGGFSEGIVAGVISLTSDIAKYYNINLDELDPGNTEKYVEKKSSKGLADLIVVILFFLFFGFRIFFFPIFFGGGFWSGGGGSGGFGGGFGGFGGGMSGGGGSSGSW